MSASELCLSNVGSDSIESFNVGVVASFSAIKNEAMGTSFSCLTFLTHEIAKRFESKGLELNSFNVLDQKIFASICVAGDDESKLTDTFSAINDVAIDHGLKLDFSLIDINDPKQLAANTQLSEIRTSVSTLLPKSQRFTKYELQKGIDDNAFIIHCQPLVDIKSAKVKGIEFLIRWEHQTKGMLYPDMFLPEIERFGLETDLDLLVLKQALTQLKIFRDIAKFAHLSISVNLYCCSLFSSELVEWLSKMASTDADLVSKLILEITETGHIEDGGTAHTNMQYIQELGYSVSLDDFGAGTTICSYLTYLNPNEIKIDRALIHTAFDKGNAKIIVAQKMLQSMIGWVQEMDNVDLVVEGIESIEQLNYLKQLGVSVGQGYIYSRPQPIHAFLDTYEGI